MPVKVALTKRGRVRDMSGTGCEITAHRKHIRTPRIRAEQLPMTVMGALWLGVFPLLNTGTYSHITLDKRLFMFALTGLTVLCAGVQIFFDRKNGPLRVVYKIPLILCALYAVWMTVTCLLGDTQGADWWNGARRYEGLSTQLCYMIVFACFCFARLRLYWLLRAAAAGVFVFCAVVIMQRAGGNPFGLYPKGRSYITTPEFQGTIGNIDMVTGYLCLMAGLLLPAGLDRINRHSVADRVLFLAGGAAAVFLVITMEVQFGLITLLVLFVLLVFSMMTVKQRVVFGAVLLAVVIIALCLLAAGILPAGDSGALWETREILQGRARLSFGNDRLAVWVYSLMMCKEHLLLGGGCDTFEVRFNRFIHSNGLVIPNEQNGTPLPNYFDMPHNEYIGILCSHGIPGLLLYLALVAASLCRYRKHPGLRGVRIAVACYLVQAFFSFSICLVAPMYWLTLGLAANRNNGTHEACLSGK